MTAISHTYSDVFKNICLELAHFLHHITMQVSEFHESKYMNCLLHTYSELFENV